MNKTDLIERFNEFIDEITNLEKADKTISTYKTYILRFIDYIDHNEPIQKKDVIDFKRMVMDLEFKPATVNLIIVSVNKYLKWIGAKELTVKKIKLQQRSSLESVISKSDYNRLLRFAKRLGYDDIYYIMKIIATTGIRISELNFFTVEAIQDSYYIHVRNKGKDRNIILTKELSRELKRYCREHRIKSGRIFNLSVSTIWRRMKRIAGAARVNKSYVHAHSFRHLFAKEYMNEFNNALELADILGHSDLKTTMVYTRSTENEQRLKLEKLQKKG